MPEAFGGNMDTPEARRARRCLGVNVPGALFSIGDGHYTMGEGEVCGVAVEGAMDTLLTVDLIKGVYCDWPRLEDDESIMVAGSYRPLGRLSDRPHAVDPLDRRDQRLVADGHLPVGHPELALADRQRGRRELHDRRQDAKGPPARRYRVDGRDAVGFAGSATRSVRLVGHRSRDHRTGIDWTGTETDAQISRGRTVATDDLESSGHIPIHRRIADKLATAIERGEYPAGSRLPSEARLVRGLGVSRGPSARRSLHSSGEA